MTVPWNPNPPATPAEIQAAIAKNNAACDFFTNVKYERTAYNTLDGKPLDFPPGVMQIEIGTQVFPFTITADRATINIPATATATIPDGTSWRMTWTPNGGKTEVLAQGVTEKLTPCCV